MNVLIIPEDFTKDQYILKPIVTAMMAELGKPQAKVRVCTDPRLGGISQALKWERIQDIIENRPMVDLFLLCVDRDGIDTRKRALGSLEEKAVPILKSNQGFFGENAWQEVEVWVLAGLDLPADWSWKDIRVEKNPKEMYFRTYAKQHGLESLPDEGRKQLAQEAARNYAKRIRSRCPEDIAALEERIGQWLSVNNP